MFTANVDDLPRAAPPVYYRRPAAPPAVPAPQPAAPPPVRVAPHPPAAEEKELATNDNQAEAETAPVPAGSASSGPAHKGAVADKAPAPPTPSADPAPETPPPTSDAVDPLLREIQKAVDEQSGRH
jgi:hypothetical protein